MEGIMACEEGREAKRERERERKREGVRDGERKGRRGRRDLSRKDNAQPVVSRLRLVDLWWG